MKTNRQAPLPVRRIDQVVRLLGQGLMVKEVAQALGVSVPTVMTYVRRIQKQRKLPDLHRVYVWCVEKRCAGKHLKPELWQSAKFFK